LSESLSIN